MIRSEALRRLIELSERRSLGAAVEFRHDEHPVASALECFPNPPLAFTLVVVPGVVREIDTSIDRGLKQLYGIGFFQARKPQVKAPKTDARHRFPCLPKFAMRHFALVCSRGSDSAPAVCVDAVSTRLLQLVSIEPPDRTTAAFIRRPANKSQTLSHNETVEARVAVCYRPRIEPSKSSVFREPASIQ